MRRDSHGALASAFSRADRIDDFPDLRRRRARADHDHELACRRLLAAGIAPMIVGLCLLVVSAWASPPSLALFLAGGIVAGIGVGAIVRGSLTVVISTASPDDRAGALATFFTVGYGTPGSDCLASRCLASRAVPESGRTGSRRRLRAAGPASAPGSAVERPAQRTPGHLTAGATRSTRLPPAQVRSVRPVRLGPIVRPSRRRPLRGGDCAARDEHGLSGPADGSSGVMPRNAKRVSVIWDTTQGGRNGHNRGPRQRRERDG